MWLCGQAAAVTPRLGSAVDPPPVPSSSVLNPRLREGPSHLLPALTGAGGGKPVPRWKPYLV